jgi:hypothetical protein
MLPEGGRYEFAITGESRPPLLGDDRAFLELVRRTSKEDFVLWWLLRWLGFLLVAITFVIAMFASRPRPAVGAEPAEEWPWSAYDKTRP